LLQRQDEVLACPAQLIAIKLGDRGDFQLPAQLRDAIPDSAGELRGAFQDALAREAGIPDFKRKDTAVSGGLQERARARSALKELVLALREVAVEAQEGRFAEAASSLERRNRTTSASRLVHRLPSSMQTRAFVTH